MKSAILVAISLAALPLFARAGEGIQVGEETAVCADGPGKDIRGTPHVAFGHDLYLAVWREGWNGEGGVARIYAARLDKQGKALDAKPIEVAPCKDGFQELPRVAFGGGLFLVVWQETRKGTAQPELRPPIVLGARISADGQVLDTAPIAIAAGPRTQAVPDVASDGSSFLVACQSLQGVDTAYRVLALPVGADGRVGAPAEIQSPWTKAAACPRLAWDGTHYRLVFLSQSLLSVRLGSDGKLLDKEPFTTLRGNLGAGIGFSHSVAAAPGRGMLAVFPRSQPDYWGWGGPGAMIGSLVGMDGKLDAGIPKEDYPQARLANWLDFGKEKKDGSPWPHGQSAVAWDGKQFVAVWPRQHILKAVSFHNCDLFASRLDGWKPLDTAGVPVAASGLEEKNPALASDGAGMLLCVYEKHAQDGAISIAARVLKTQ